MQDRTKAFIDAIVSLWFGLGQEGADLLSESDGDLDRVVRRFLEQKDDDFEREQMVGYLLIDKLGNKRRGRDTRHFVVSTIGPSELADYTGHDQFPHCGQLGVDHGYQGCKDGRKG